MTEKKNDGAPAAQDLPEVKKTDPPQVLSVQVASNPLITKMFSRSALAREQVACYNRDILKLLAMRKEKEAVTLFLEAMEKENRESNPTHDLVKRWAHYGLYFKLEAKMVLEWRDPAYEI